MGTIVVSAILIAAVVLALVFSRKRAGGDCGCGGSCPKRGKDCPQKPE